MFNFDKEVVPMIHSNWQWADYFFKLKELATTMFTWHNLPDTIPQMVLEEHLFNYGFAIFFKDPNYGYLALKGAASGLDVNGLPSMFQPTSPVASFPVMTSDECVQIRNNYDRYPTAQTAFRYASALYDLDSTRDVNLQAQKTPYILAGEKSEERSLKAIFEKIVRNVPVMYLPKSLTNLSNKIQVLKTEAPFIAGSVQDMKVTIMNEYLNMIGLAIADEKRERRTDDEVFQFNRKANAFANTFLKPRVEACDAINAKFNLNVSVELSVDEMNANPEFEQTKNYNYTGWNSDYRDTFTSASTASGGGSVG